MTYKLRVHDAISDTVALTVVGHDKSPHPREPTRGQSSARGKVSRLSLQSCAFPSVKE